MPRALADTGRPLGCLAAGRTNPQILSDYAELSAEPIRAGLACIAEREAHEVRLPAAADGIEAALADPSTGVVIVGSAAG